MRARVTVYLTGSLSEEPILDRVSGECMSSVVNPFFGILDEVQSAAEVGVLG